MILIDGEKLLEKMYRYTDNEGAKMPYGDDDSLIHKDSACFLIENAPTIEPKRKNGKWIFLGPNGFKCSRCGRYLGIEYGDVKMNFCPHCGSYNGEGDNYVWR